MAKQTALITGASAGLGREYARLFAKDGHDLVLVARRRDRLDELARELSATHGTACTVMAADLATASAGRLIADQVRAAGLAIDFLVNNAGFGRRGFFAQLDVRPQLETIDVNVRALVELTHLFLPGMLERKQGRILNIASMAGFVPGPFMATYYASKAFVISFTEALAGELHGTGVTVTASCPGPTATEFGDVAGNSKSNLFKRHVADAVSVARHGYLAMLAGKVVAIPGLQNKLSVQSVRIAPRAAVRAIAGKLNSDRAPDRN
ncbi:MAG: SDR family oxidoreductase [Polyangia bacterium]